MSKRPELLAPVGRRESFYAAIENGANAVYVGGKQFSARQFAQNLDTDELKEIVEYAKLRNIKVYVTVNTLVKNKEMDDFALYIHQLSVIGVDAIIVQDFGVARVINKYFKGMALHASTQMSAHSQYDVKFLKDCGYKRVVLARELSLGEVRVIKKAVDIEIETFVHGALCVSYSGQCLMSSIIGGRSGNRGRCAQPCRLPYIFTKDGVDITKNDSSYLMSPKDVQTLDIIPELIEAGIDTFKIEGRMKGPEYIASVARIYHKYINLALEKKQYTVTQADQDELLTVFNRGGFTEGYFSQKPGKSMMAIDSPKNIGLLIGEVISYHKGGNIQIKTNKKLNPGDGIGVLTQAHNHVGVGISKEVEAGDILKTIIKGPISIGDPVYLSKDHQLSKELTQSYNKNMRKSFIEANLQIKLGQPIKLELIHENGAQVSVAGDIVEKAKNAPMSPEKLRAQISKFGNTPFETSNVTLDYDPDVFVSIASLNGLRREATQALITKILGVNQYDGGGYTRYLEDKKIKTPKTHGKKHFTASVSTTEQLEACLEFATSIYLELAHQSFMDIEKAIQTCHAKGVKIYIALPHIQRKKDYELYNDLMVRIEASEIDGYVVRTYGQFEKLRGSNKEKVIDYTLNVVNNENICHWESYGADTITLSVELKADEIQETSGKCLEMVVYGHIPIMTTEQCLIGRHGECPKNKGKLNGIYKLTDRKEEEYPLVTNCKMCRMQILSSKPIMLANQMSRIEKLPIHTMRLIFTIEDSEQVEEVISWYTDETLHTAEYTNRYFTQGVE
ncbi:MAG TPA: U32 family peptidase [Epulopiscium sp.]|nr:U32 family peptidase [Candidatus Epulonipiscium sp.]